MISTPARRPGIGRPLALLLAALSFVVSACQNPNEPEEPLPDQGPELATGSTPRTYYVSPSGSDRNAGTSTSKPWKTLNKVSNTRFYPGDRILLQGGATFSGKVYFDGRDAGSASSPITLSTYGSGRAIINAGGGDAVMLYNTAGYIIRNLTLKGSGRTSNTGSGINAYTDLSGGVKLDYLRVDSVEASGFGKYGIVFGSWNGTTGFKNVTVTYASVHDNATAGIATYAQAYYTHQNVYFGHVKSYSNPGKSGTTSPSGSGIVLAGVSGGMVERSVAHDNGILCDAKGGPVGIWAYNSERVTLQYNESYQNRTALADGGGFDLDQNSRNSIMQYNYSHNNDGAGFLMAHSVSNANHGGNVIRYNISENDSRKRSAGGIVIWARTQSDEIYQNTVYMSPTPYGTPRAVFIHNSSIASSYLTSVHLRNNTFYTTGGLSVIYVMSGVLSGSTDFRFEGNNYYGGATTTKVQWGSGTYTTLSTWRSATGQEQLSGVAVGSLADPVLTKPGGGGTIGDADKLTSLAAYKLASTSPLINRGLDLAQRFGLTMPGKDFYAGTTPYGTALDVGAHEWR